MDSVTPRRGHIGTDVVRVEGPDTRRQNDTERPLLTAGVTAYNAADTIERAVNSALAQTWQPLEILIVDDGSTDDTRDILGRLEAQHPNIRVILHHTNQGTAAARNTLIEHAQGEAIAFFDDDDTSHPERIERQWARLTAYEQQVGFDRLVLCYSGREQVFPDSSIAVHRGRGSSSASPGVHGQQLIAALLWGRELPREERGTAGTCTQLGRVATFKRLGGFDPHFRRAQDVEMDVRLARSGGHIVSVAEPLVTQYLQPATDRNLDAIENARRLLLEKHADAFPSTALLVATTRWGQARFALRRGRKKRALRLMWLSFAAHPAFAAGRLIRFLFANSTRRIARRGGGAATLPADPKARVSSSAQVDSSTAEDEATSPPRILLLIDHLPHYRAGLIGRIDLEYSLTVASVPGYSSTVPEMQPGPRNRIALRQRKIGPFELFLGALSAALWGRYELLLVFANARWPHVWLTTMIARLRGRKVVHWGHGWTGRESTAVGRLRTLLHSSAHATLVFGSDARELATRVYGMNPDKVLVIWNSLPWTDQPAKVAQPPSEETTVLLVSRLVPERRVDLLIEAVAELAQRGRDVRAIIVGEGPEGAMAQELAEQHGVQDRIEFVGACYDEDRLRNFYSRASLAVIPGKVGLAAVAAAGYGLPIVCSSDPKRHAPEVELVEHLVTGIRFDSDDPQAIADAVETGLDPQVWHAMSEEAMSRVRDRYSPSAQFEVFSTVVDHILCEQRV